MYPLSKPSLGDLEIEAVANVLRSGWIMQGPETEAFEKEFAAYTGAKFAVAVANGTAALFLALVAAGVGPDDEVITVSHSFIATANAIWQAGAKPVFVDVDPLTFNMDPDLAKRAITPATKAIVAVHQVGMPCALDEIRRIAVDNSLVLIEDAACAIGSEIRRETGRWERIGACAGSFACFSFHPRKVLTTGEGGMITSNDSYLADKVRHLRQHALSRKPEGEVFDQPAFNFRLTDIQSAIGRAQLADLDQTIKGRRLVAKWYREELSRHGLSQLMPVEPEDRRSNWQSLSVGLPVGVSQEDVLDALARDGIACKTGIMNAHLQPAWASTTAEPLPNSERAEKRRVLLPLYAELTQKDVIGIVSTFARLIKTL